MRSIFLTENSNVGSDVVPEAGSRSIRLAEIIKAAINVRVDVTV